MVEQKELQMLQLQAESKQKTLECKNEAAKKHYVNHRLPKDHKALLYTKIIRMCQAPIQIWELPNGLINQSTETNSNQFLHFY